MNEESSWQRRDASTDRIAQDTPSTGAHTLHQRPIDEQRGTGHHEEEEIHVPTSRTGLCGHEKRSNPGGESIPRGIVHTVNKHVARIHATPITIPKPQIEYTAGNALIGCQSFTGKARVRFINAKCSYLLAQLLERVIQLQWLYHLVAAQMLPRTYHRYILRGNRSSRFKLD